MNASEWRKGARLFGLFRPASRLPMPLAYRVAEMVGFLDYHIRADLRQVIGSGLAAAVTEAKDPAQREDWVRHYCKMMSREVMDAFFMSRLNQDNSTSLVSIPPDSLALMRSLREEERGIIVVMAHYGRLNLLLLALAMAGYDLGMLTIAVDERNPDLSPVDRAYLGGKVAALQKQIRGRWVSLGDNLRGLYQGLKSGEIIIILMDAYHTGQDDNRIELPFLGGHLNVSEGIVRLAEKTGARMIYGAVRDPLPSETGKASWQAVATLRPLPEEPAEALKQSVAWLEQDVQEMPWLWWHWNILDYIWKPAVVHE
ncbi:MAG: hypothetical protein KKH74_07795 [Gammaproteobacteria bacterium]|nr:hypothetical protein [Gammaproteobacteria bacterium]MBU1732207.1 hypothetical protein [Gammaproteobacteria bacterium]MBU1893263.1 hypothetical protein [Gammaproteobacteria bacterium]